ncbi:MAG: sensor histidine kinase [Anaerolineae bacterium]|nr:sensor histidine kinase [Anaerolineae bacterium]
MRTVGVYLIYAAVGLRGLVRLANEPGFGLAAVLLAMYGLLLVLAETRFGQHGALHLSLAEHSGFVPSRDGGLFQGESWVLLAYLLLQAGLVVGLLLVPPILDFFGLLFIPLSLQAVFFFGRRFGFLCIGLFFLAMAGPMLIDEKGWVFGLTMTVLNTGYCLLFSGYAHQVQRAETVRAHNQHLLGDLQVAHRRLQGYATQVEALAAERERSRLARELHDSVTQTVFSMNLTVQSVRLLLAKEPDLASGQLERLEELAAGAMGEIQALVSQLRPPSLAEEGLPAALRRLAAERQARDGLQVTVEVKGETDKGAGALPDVRHPLPEPIAEAVYHIAQEALTNVAKHAATGQATVRLNLATGALLLEVEDAGLGFDPELALGRRGHIGLAGMAERAGEIGWSLSIESRPGCGTRIRVEENPPEGAT